MAKASVLGANAAVNGQSVNQGLGNSVLTEYKVYVNPYLVVTPFRDWMDYTKHYYMGAIRVASELGGTPCFDPSVIYATLVSEPGAGGIPNNLPGWLYTEDPCTDVSAVSAEWELADVLKELSIIEVGDENQEGWEDLIASRNVELNMTESEFTTWMEQNCPPEYAPIPPPGSSWETPREGSILTIGQGRCACELSAYWAELLYGIECDDYRLLYWYHPDYLGHVELVTDPLGNPYQYFFYGAFGDVLAEQNTPWGSFQSSYQFNSKEFDSETGYGYYGARYYAPEWSVWLSVDPKTHLLPSWSPYVYGLNNPILMIDPDGQFPWPVYVRSFISTPTTGGGLFRGDGRGASFTGTSRVYSAFTVDPSARSVSQPLTQSDPTVFYGAPNPLNPMSPLPPRVETGTPTGSNDNISFAGNMASFDFSHSGKDPITPQWVTPALDVHAGLSFSEDLEKGVLSITGSFTGDVFPSTEAFITDQSGKTKLFLGAQKESGGILNLIGDNKKLLFKVNMQVLFDNNGNFTGVKEGETTYSVDEWNKKVQTDFDR